MNHINEHLLKEQADNCQKTCLLRLFLSTQMLLTK
jgi:hypothetical protein